MSEQYANDTSTPASLMPTAASDQALIITAPNAIRIKDEEDRGPKLDVLSRMSTKGKELLAKLIGDLEPEIQQLQNQITIAKCDNTLLTREVAKLKANNMNLKELEIEIPKRT